MFAAVVIAEATQVAINVFGKALSMAAAIQEEVGEVRMTGGRLAPIHREHVDDARVFFYQRPRAYGLRYIVEPLQALWQQVVRRLPLAYAGPISVGRRTVRRGDSAAGDRLGHIALGWERVTRPINRHVWVDDNETSYSLSASPCMAIT